MIARDKEGHYTLAGGKVQEESLKKKFIDWKWKEGNLSTLMLCLSFSTDLSHCFIHLWKYLLLVFPFFGNTWWWTMAFPIHPLSFSHVKFWTRILLNCPGWVEILTLLLQPFSMLVWQSWGLFSASLLFVFLPPLLVFVDCFPNFMNLLHPYVARVHWIFKMGDSWILCSHFIDLHFSGVRYWSFISSLRFPNWSFLCSCCLCVQLHLLALQGDLWQGWAFSTSCSL